MRYDFDTVVNRRGTNAVKWDVAEGELPMSIADMDFVAAPEIREAIMKRANHGVFGYADVPDSWYDAVSGWWARRHGVTYERAWLSFCTGVIPAISSVVRKLTTPAENVLIQSPVYNVFYNSILNNGCRVLENPLVYQDGVYDIDWKDLEDKLALPQTTLMILCNPHNPVGKIWDKDTLARIGEMCARHHVVVISDEIHCDLTDPGKAYVPFISASETCKRISVTCVAPTKTFNLAGLQTSAVVVPDEGLRNRVFRALNTDEVAEPNVFAIQAAEAAFNEGAPWLDELRQYIFEGKQMVRDVVASSLPKVKVVPSEGTYLLWLDVSALPGDGTEIAAYLREKTGLILNDGRHYGETGAHFLRMNLAYPHSVVADGVNRLVNGLHAYEQEKAAL